MAKKQLGDVVYDDVTGEICMRTLGDITPKRVKIDANSAAAAGNELVAAVSGKKICVLGICLIAAEAVNVTFYSDAADTGTAISGAMPLSESGGFVLPAPVHSELHWFETVAGESLTMLLNAAVQCSGWLVYYEE